MTDKTPNEAEPSVDPSCDFEEVSADESASATSARPVKRRTSQAPVKNAASTPKRPSKTHADDSATRVGPITFTKQSVSELKKVNWPTGEQLRQYFFVVLLFVLFIIAFVGLLDLGFVAGLLKLFG